MKKAILALADGTWFEGRALGAEGETGGEVVFNTAMTGYQEVLTDPSYKGQIITMTCSHIGNYGTTAEDSESRRLWAEVQPPAWILDGGIFLFGWYVMALIFTAVWELKIVRRLRDPEDRRWAAVIVAANFGTLAMVFTFVPFASQVGIQFWFLEGVLHGAMASRMSRWD